VDKPFIVEYVNFDKTRLMDNNNVYHQEVKIGKAKELAKFAGLDLVCFNQPTKENIAFCKILDYGKWKYAEEKSKRKHKEVKKDTKEVRFTPLIADNDIAHKIRQAKEFLLRGDDVAFLMILKGREKHYFDDAVVKMDKIVSGCKDVGHETFRKLNKEAGNIIIRFSKGVKKEKENEERNVNSNVNSNNVSSNVV